MIIKVLGDNREMYIFLLKDFIAANGLENEIEPYFEQVLVPENFLEIEIKDTNDFILISCPQLDFNSCLRNKEEVNRFILKCCGFKEINLTGMRVKDHNNNKIRPEISIFTQDSIINTLPSVLEYTKIMIKGPKDVLVKQKVFFDSDILKSILESSNVYFKDSDRHFEFILEEKGYAVKFTHQPIETALDHLFDRTLLGNLSKHMKIMKKYPMFECFLNGKVENLVFNKRVLGKIKNSTEDLKNLLEFVEHAHKFQDQRDEVVCQLKEFLSKTFPPEFVNTYQYLHVFKYKLPKVKNAHCLKNFTESQENPQI
ncbi:hypothetical protein GINT2_000374 [Glugoides intestinalis]